MKQRAILKTISLAFAGLFFLVSPDKSLAQAFFIQAHPAITSVSIPSEESEKTVTVKLRNLSDETVRLKAQIWPLEQIDKLTGRPVYSAVDDLDKTQQSFYQTAIKIEVDEEISDEVILSPKQENDVNITITYNKNQKPSEYYFTLVFTEDKPSPKKDNSPSQISAASSIQGGVSSHILVSLGTGKAEIEASNLTADKSFEPYPSFELTLKNNSNRHSKVYGNISLYNIFGQKIGAVPFEKYLLAANDADLQLKPLQETGKPYLSLGVNKAVLEITDAGTGKQHQKDIYYIAMPLKGFFLTVIIGGFIFFILARAIKKSSQL